MTDFPPPPISLRLAEDGFVPDDVLASLLETGRAERTGALLRMADGRRYLLEYAVRVLGCRSRETDPYGITGLVESVEVLLRRGFLVSAQAIALNRVAYDVEYGSIACPLAFAADETGVNRCVG